MKYFNRYSQQIEEEKVPGENGLHFLYETGLGKCFLNLLIKKPWFSRLAAVWANSKCSKRSIDRFIHKYHVDMGPFEARDYLHFNDFFYRKLKKDQRPISQEPNAVCFPAEGRHLGFQSIQDGQTFFVKGKAFNLVQLLGNEEIAKRFQGGTCIISRLCPIDYHRFHFCCSGVPQEAYAIPGPLYSVQPIALQKSCRIFEENKRFVTLLQSEQLGWVASIEVGATFIGSIQQTYTSNTPVQMGDEKGYFLFGGSTVITFFEPGKVQLADDLLHYTRKRLELFAHVRDFMGKIIS